MNAHLKVGCEILLAWCMACAVAVAQPPPPRPPQPAGSGGSSSTERFISSSVLASWMQHQRASDGDTRSLLVLWRGTPGWFTKRGPDGGRSSAGGGSGSSAWQTFTEGGLTFELEYDFDRKVVRLLGQEVSLTDSNVLLVDDVDSPAGPRIVDRLWVDTPPQNEPTAPDPIYAIVRQSPRLFEFVRCDTKMPDTGAPPAAAAYFGDVLATMCAQMRPR
jgi:hypothetical protein